MFGFRFRTNHAEVADTQRLETFSDGVFSIIVTLLAFNLKAPELNDEASNNDALRQLLRLLPDFLGFTLSFTFIAIVWVNHHLFFQSIKKTTTKLLWLNNLLLFWVCFVPFPTSFVGEHPTHPVAVALLGAVFFMASSSFAWMRYHATYQADLVQDDIPDEEKKQAFRRTLVGPVVYLLSTGLSFVSVWVALGLNFGTALFYFVPVATLNRRQVREMKKAERE
ncbi:MAG: DUF1211 domain-containing protein [Sphingobacteriaceae bacterium]|nr:DUF1211 domain-containing protein [Cytophagaceae bacterium]